MDKDKAVAPQVGTYTKGQTIEWWDGRAGGKWVEGKVNSVDIEADRVSITSGGKKFNVNVGNMLRSKQVPKAVAKEPWQTTRAEYWDSLGWAEKQRVLREAKQPIDVGTDALDRPWAKLPRAEQRPLESVLSRRLTARKWLSAQPAPKVVPPSAGNLDWFKVSDALSEGKPVPVEVLKDYPDLAKQVPKAEAGMADDVISQFGGIEGTRAKMAKLEKSLSGPKVRPQTKIDNRILPTQLKERLAKIETEAEAVNETGLNFYRPDDVVVYGGIPVRFSTVVRSLDKVAQAVDKKNSISIREAGIKGFMQSKRAVLPNDVQPLTYEEFELVTNLPSGEKVPELIGKKWRTMYSPEKRARLESAETRPTQETKTVNGIQLVKSGDGWFTKDGLYGVDIDQLGKPTPRTLVSLAQKASSPEIFIQRLQMGLGARDKEGNPSMEWGTFEERKAKGTTPTRKHYRGLLSWIESNYPGKGWFYAAKMIWEKEHVEPKSKLQSIEESRFKAEAGMAEIGQRDQWLQNQALEKHRDLIQEEVKKAGNRKVGMKVAADRLAKQVDIRTGMPIDENLKDAKLIRQATQLPASGAMQRYSEAEKQAKSEYSKVLRATGSHEKAFEAENRITTKAQQDYETTLSTIELRGRHDSRSLLSQTSDERQEHSLVLEPDDSRIETWKRDPGRADVRGIDTPKKTKRKVKSPARSRPRPITSLRSLR